MNNYKKIEIVGKGSFGYAVLVQSVLDGNYYIMKIIDVLKMDRKQREEALNEVKFLKALRHPFIITYRESFMDKNRYLCIVMDYADGGDMYSKIAKQKKLGKAFSESQILDWFVQICLALKYVHDRKILHRDLKTQNIFLTSKGEIKIGDFGIARVLQSTYDYAQTAIGTPYYLSPEICQEKPYNQKSDIWSLGCILYEIITLKHAFDATSMKALVFKILRGSYPEVPKSYSEELKSAISEMLSKDPADRPSIKKILEKDFLASRIPKLVTNALNNRTEMTQTLLKKSNNERMNYGGEIQKTETAEKNEKNSNKKELDVLKDKNQNNSEIKLTLLKNRGEKSKERKNENLTEESTKDKLISPNNFLSENLRAGHMHKNSGSSFHFKSEDQPAKKTFLEKEEKRSEVIKFGKNLIKPMIKDDIVYEKITIIENTEDRDEQLKNLILSTQEFVKNSFSKQSNKETKAKEEEEEICEKNEDRAIANFLTVDGKLVPGISEKDSISYRIEALRFYLENQLGDESFIKAYQYLQDNNLNDEEKSNGELVQLIGNTNMKFLPLIFQLIICEDSYYCNSNN